MYLSILVYNSLLKYIEAAKPINNIININHIYITLTFLFKIINLFKYLFKVVPNMLLLTFSFTCNLINSCITNIKVNVKQIAFIPCIENNRPSNGLVIVSSTNLFIDSLMFDTLLFSILFSNALALLIWLTPECIKPPISPLPITIAAFCTGGILDLVIALPTAPATPTILAPEPS